MSEKPDNALWDENCGNLDNSRAVDAQCLDIMPFFCYRGKVKLHSVLYLDKLNLILEGKFLDLICFCM